ncbi:MAG: IPT/TIG domain-containing protein [Bryobacterales bacterium]|nr:IPT/TIG domain-containing protein [Bryobacterales bacterium]
MTRRVLVCGTWREALAFLLLACPAFTCAAELSLPERTGAPGSSLTAPLAFAAQGNPVTGLQFDVQYDSSAMNVTFTAGEGLRAVGKNLHTVQPDYNRRRVLVIGSNQKPLPDGVLLNTFINLYSNAKPGTYALTISSSFATNAAGDNLPLSITAGNITVKGGQDQAVRLSSDGVVNAASMAAGPVAPGEVITLIGSDLGPVYPVQAAADHLDTVLNGTRVLLNGVAASLLFASPNQINAIVPVEATGAGTVSLEVQTEGATRAQAAVLSAVASPALFTADATGAGQAVVFNQDASLNSALNPASRGSEILLLLNGAGSNQPADVSVQIGGTAAEILALSPSSGLVPSLTLVRCRVPGEIMASQTAGLMVTVGAAASQSGVTLAVQ